MKIKINFFLVFYCFKIYLFDQMESCEKALSEHVNFSLGELFGLGEVHFFWVLIG